MNTPTKLLLNFLVFAVIWNIGISTYHTGHPFAFMAFRPINCFRESKTLGPGEQTYLLYGYEDAYFGRMSGIHILSVFRRHLYNNLEYSYGCYDLDKGTRYVDNSWLFWFQIKLGLRKQYLEVIRNVDTEPQDLTWQVCSTYY